MVYYVRALVYFVYFIFLGTDLSKGARVFTIVNECKETIWPAITQTEGDYRGGYVLKQGQSIVFTAPVGWSGRIWARTDCNFDSFGSGTCQTGSCGTSLNCTSTGVPPFSIAEFSLGDVDYYDASLVDGFNLPLVIAPVNGTGNCSKAGCDGDLRLNCPSELAVKSSSGKIIACKSACNVFNNDEYCCRGVYNTPMTCMASNYSKSFKEVCPAAYSYAYDDKTSIITCSAADYTITFCASRNQAVCTSHNNVFACNGTTSPASSKDEPFIKWLWVFVTLAYTLLMNPSAIVS